MPSSNRLPDRAVAVADSRYKSSSMPRKGSGVRHAEEQMTRRQIPREWLESPIENPEQRVPQPGGKGILQYFSILLVRYTVTTCGLLLRGHHGLRTNTLSHPRGKNETGESLCRQAAARCLLRILDRRLQPLARNLAPRHLLFGVSGHQKPFGHRTTLIPRIRQPPTAAVREPILEACPSAACSSRLASSWSRSDCSLLRREAASQARPAARRYLHTR